MGKARDIVCPATPWSPLSSRLGATPPQIHPAYPARPPLVSAASDCLRRGKPTAFPKRGYAPGRFLEVFDGAAPSSIMRSALQGACSVNYLDCVCP